LRGWLAQHPGIDADKVDLSIPSFGDEGVELSMKLALNVANDAEEKQLREEIQGEVQRQVQESGIGLANSQQLPLESAGQEMKRSVNSDASRNRAA
jgi:hypothetical protein